MWTIFVISPQSLIQSPSGSTAIPKWVSSALLLTDLYQKISTADARRKALQETTKNKKVIWKWFDDRQAKWQAYNENSQKDIDSAFKKGEQLVRLTQNQGRRKYTIYLTKMIQVNEESHRSGFAEKKNQVLQSVSTKFLKVGLKKAVRLNCTLPGGLTITDYHRESFFLSDKK